MGFTEQPGDPDVFRFPELDCPWCGKRLDAASPTGTDTRPPIDGDGMFCFRCVNPAVVVISAATGIIALRKPTPEEKAEMLDRDNGFLRNLLDFHEKNRDQYP